MDHVAVTKPLIKSGWLRVLLFCAVFLLFALISLIVIGLLIGWIRKEGGSTGKEVNVKEMMTGEFLWLSVLSTLVSSTVIVFLFRKLIDRKSFLSLGFITKGSTSDALSGLFLGPVMLGTGALILFITRHLEWTDISFNGSALFIDLGILMMVAFTEELVFRGYILNNLMESFNKWTALLISAALFTISHLDNPGINFIPIVNIFFAGVLLGVNYIYTKNLWFAILFHLGWNFFQGPILGFGVSGLNFPSLLQFALKGDLSITGGDFGFEASMVDGVVTFLAIVLLYFVYEKKYGKPVTA